MAELEITERQIGDVTVLDIDGELRIGDSSVALRRVVRRLVDEGRRKFVLDLAGIRYLDSSGNGELISSYTYIARRNGKMNLANLTEKIQDFLTITKLLTVYDVYDSVEEAIRSLTTGEDKYITCPIRGCEHCIRFCPDLSLFVLCTNCGTEISLTTLPSTRKNQVAVNSLTLPTYEKEQIKVEVGTPTTIRILGRLDLFSSEVLEKAWSSLPPPRRVLFRISRYDEISSQGLNRLLALCNNQNTADKSVVVWPRKKSRPILYNSAICVDEKRAIDALGDIARAPLWALEILDHPARDFA